MSNTQENMSMVHSMQNFPVSNNNSKTCLKEARYRKYNFFVPVLHKITKMQFF